MAELVDAPDSKSGSGNRVRVRVSPEAPLLEYFSGYTIESKRFIYPCFFFSDVCGFHFQWRREQISVLLKSAEQTSEAGNANVVQVDKSLQSVS